jgi:hypothetical protein
MSDAPLSKTALPNAIAALQPRAGSGHQFVCYGDCCSGVPQGAHEANLAAVNAVADRLRPRPEFVCFLGDEIVALTTDPDALRRQWRYWLDHEMGWLDRRTIPLFHTTSNHTTYDARSEDVFREVLSHIPRNGPLGQEGLTYFVRRDDLLLIFVNTTWSGLGGEGHIETAWLDRTLTQHADARYKLVMGHHPVYPANGFSGSFQRELGPQDGKALWEALVRHQVLAYVCSHMLAFDVQVHDGVLQILTAGAGTAPLMPEDSEYLHCVQMALDPRGLRYQVLDTSGRAREWLDWPLRLPPADAWARLSSGECAALVHGDDAPGTRLLALRFSGRASAQAGSEPQTLLSAWNPGPALAPLWIGLAGPEQRLTVWMSRGPGRSPHHWLGPTFDHGKPFAVQLAIHTGMGPGGLLWRWDDDAPWSSMRAASPWGAEALAWPARWSIGHGPCGREDRPFQGEDLHARAHIAVMVPEGT